MKKYRLLKDLPLAKVGTIFEKANSTMCQCDGKLDVPLEFFIGKFDEWFEEAEESGSWRPMRQDPYYFAISNGDITNDAWTGCKVDEERYAFGNCFETEKQAEEAVERMKTWTRLRHMGAEILHYRYDVGEHPWAKLTLQFPDEIADNEDKLVECLDKLIDQTEGTE